MSRPVIKKKGVRYGIQRLNERKKCTIKLRNKVCIWNKIDKEKKSRK